MKVLVLVLVLDHEVLVLVLNILVLVSEKTFWQFFKTFVVILDGSEQGTSWHLMRDNKSSLPF